MSRIEAVTFSEFYLFEETTHPFGLFPANDPLPLYGMPFQQNERDPAEAVDPLGATTHLYSPPNAGSLGGPGGACFAGWGRWDITQVMVTNANPYRVYWCLYKFPPATYKDTSAHTFTRYTGAAPTGADAVDIRLHAPFYAQPLDAFTTFTTEPGYRLIAQAGESLWGCCNPGWLWSGRGPALPATPTKATTMRLTGDIVE
jgi:hypothetical protein